MQTGLIAFDIISKINGVNIDLRSVVREYAITKDEIKLEELLLIMKRFDFKARVKNISPDELVKCEYPLPAVILRKDGLFSVLLKINKEEKRCLIYSIEENQTKDINFTTLEGISGNNFIILSHKIINEKIKFGFKWFFNEILTYKQIILEVMIGSFIVQLFGLVTPLFTQVILDKVIVHRSLITLNVLTFAFVVLMVF